MPSSRSRSRSSRWTRISLHAGGLAARSPRSAPHARTATRSRPPAARRPAAGPSSSPNARAWLPAVVGQRHVHVPLGDVERQRARVADRIASDVAEALAVPEQPQRRRLGGHRTSTYPPAAAVRPRLVALGVSVSGAAPTTSAARSIDSSVIGSSTSCDVIDAGIEDPRRPRPPSARSEPVIGFVLWLRFVSAPKSSSTATDLSMSSGFRPASVARGAEPVEQRWRRSPVGSRTPRTRRSTRRRTAA